MLPPGRPTVGTGTKHSCRLHQQEVRQIGHQHGSEMRQTLDTVAGVLLCNITVQLEQFLGSRLKR